jgi:SAM-dependent methyltransferase
MMPSQPPHREAQQLSDRWDRERIFHDDLAALLDPSTLPATELGRADQVMLAAAAIGPGTRVLDLGCGQGDLTLALLARGAEVTGLDLSAGMLEVARRRIELYGNGRRAHLVAAPVERTGLPTASFDAIVGRWILHHIDLDPAAPELARILAPGGRAIFYENSGANRVLTFARNHVAGRFGIPRLGTKDERPLIADDWRALGHSFSTVRGEFPSVEVFGLFSRQVLRYRSDRAAAVCGALDRTIARTPLRRYSYRVLVVAEK